MLETKNTNINNDIAYYYKNKSVIDTQEQRTFMDKFFSIIFIPLICSLLLSLIIGLFSNFEYFLVTLFLSYFIVLYITLLEFLQLERVIKLYPEFQYIYTLAIKDEEHKANKKYVSDVSKLQTRINKTKDVAKKRFLYSIVFGLASIALSFVLIFIIQPNSVGLTLINAGFVLISILTSLVNYIGASQAVV